MQSPEGGDGHRVDPTVDHDPLYSRELGAEALGRLEQYLESDGAESGGAESGGTDTECTDTEGDGSEGDGSEGITVEGIDAEGRDDDEADRAARLAHDRLLVERLRINNFAGIEYERFLEELVRLGLSTCLKWINSGRMRRESAKKLRPITDLPLTATAQDRLDLAIEAAVEGADLFRRFALIAGRWSPDRGATLRTYYIGACIQVYPGVFRRWHRQHQKWAAIDTMAENEEPEGLDSACESVPLRMLLKEAMQRLSAHDEHAYVALRMQADGHSYADISKVLKRSERAVEGILRRGRQKIKRILKELGGPYD